MAFALRLFDSSIFYHTFFLAKYLWWGLYQKREYSQYFNFTQFQDGVSVLVVKPFLLISTTWWVSLPAEYIKRDFY